METTNDWVARMQRAMDCNPLFNGGHTETPKVRVLSDWRSKTSRRELKVISACGDNLMVSFGGESRPVTMTASHLREHYREA